jgi:hypothetical protein
MNIYNLDELKGFLNSQLKPKDKEKQLYGEVFTPLGLVEEMLDKLPIEVWSNPDLKWLEPSAGIGNFVLIVYIRLMDGLKDVIIDEEERRKHILENMIYMVELNKSNVDKINEIFISDKYKLNIHNGSFLEDFEF